VHQMPESTPVVTRPLIQAGMYSTHIPGPFGPIAMMSCMPSQYQMISVDGQPLILPQDFRYMEGFGSWASECSAGPPARRRRPRRGKGGASRGHRLGMITTSECQERQKSTADIASRAPVVVPAAVVASDVLGSDPKALSENADLSMKILTQLESKDKAKRSSILSWILPEALELSLSVHGCRIVQKALDVACGDDRDTLATKFHGHVEELLKSQHGNHVLQKCIEVLPPHAVQFIIDELARWPLSWAQVAKARFGCRVIERLLEHCPPRMTAPLIDAVVRDASALARHPYGNYVVQHALDYASPAHRTLLVAEFVESGIAFLAQHRIASNVVERALRDHGQDQQTIGLAFLAAPQTLLATGCSRYGTHVVHRLLDVLDPGSLRVEAIRQLIADPQQLMASKHSKKLIDKLQELICDSDNELQLDSLRRTAISSNLMR